MLRILYAIPRLSRAGTERHLLNLAAGLSKEGFQVTICTLFRNEDSDEQFSVPNVKSICFARKNVYDLRILFDFWRLFKKEKFDIVHAYLFGFHYLVTIPAKLLRIPLIISSRRELATWKKIHHHFLENLSNLFTDKIIACSNAVKNFALRHELFVKGKILTVYNGINLGEFYPRQKNINLLKEFDFNPEDKIIGMVSNFSSSKGHGALLDAVLLIKKTFTSIKCLLIGDGPLRRNIENKIRCLGLPENVKLTGKRGDIPDLLSLLHIFVFVSLSEGLPHSILEAMACGLPVVATNVGGIPEVVENGQSGILIKTVNSQDIGSAVIELLKNNNLRNGFGMRGNEIIKQKFSLERMIRDYKNLYTNI